MLLEVHKVSFIVWGVLFGVHFLAYASRAVRLALGDWQTGPRRAVPGVGVRSMLVTATVGAAWGLHSCSCRRSTTGIHKCPPLLALLGSSERRHGVDE